MIAHTLPTISKLLGLPESDIYQLAQNSGKIFYNIKEDNFNISIDSIDLTLSVDEKEIKQLSRMLFDAADFNMSIKDNLIIVESVKEYPSSILCSESLKPMLTNFIDITNNISVLITDHNSMPVFLGNNKVLSRMSEDFNTNHKIYPISNFLGEANV